MTSVIAQCATCGTAAHASDRFCERCGDRLVPPAAAACAHCGEAAFPGDRYCGGCGRPITADRPATAAGPVPSSAPPPAAGAIPAGALLRDTSPMCLACGADVGGGWLACGQCGTTLVVPSAFAPIGTVHEVRRGLRRRPAVRVGGDGETAQLLFESGETVAVPVQTLPPARPAPIGSAAPLTPHGVLLALAATRGAGARGWEPAALRAAAIAAVDGVGTARLVALDAVRLGFFDVVAQLPLSASERTWLDAVVAAERRDPTGVVRAVAALPPDRYRHKLVLLFSVAGGAGRLGRDGAVLGPHLDAYADEPVAGLLGRVLGLAPTDRARLVDDIRLLRQVVPLTPAAARDVDAAVVALTGGTPAAIGDLAMLGPATRTVIALAGAGPVALDAASVRSLDAAVVDDLVDTGTVDAAVLLAAGWDEQRSSYLRARLVPGSMTDDEVGRAGHVEEAARRAFLSAEPSALDALGDGPGVRHFRALSALRRRRPGDVVLDDVRPEARPVVAGLLATAELAGAGQLSGATLPAAVVDDPTAWPILLDLAGGNRIALSPDLRDRHPAFAEWLALQLAREHLFTGEWRRALEAADECLALSRLEEIRDEALNLRACALHYLGEDAAAIAALEEAIEGAYSEALLTNIGIVAAGLRPEVAAAHLGRLVDEAPTTAMRLAAAARAVAIWAASDTASWRQSDTGRLPDAIRGPLRRLVADDIPVDDFRPLAALLATNDGTWLADAASLARSPNRRTLEARFYVARAKDLFDVVDVMAGAIRAGSPPQWLLDERDALRDAAVDILFENLDDPDNTFGAVALAMEEKGVLADERDAVLFGLLGLAGVTFHLTTRGEEIADRYVDLLHDLRKRRSSLPADDRDRLEAVVELATRRVAINRIDARRRILDQAIDVYNAAVDLGRNAYPGSTGSLEARRRIQAVAQLVGPVRAELRRWLPLVDHEGVRTDLHDLIEVTRDIEQHCMNALG